VIVFALLPQAAGAVEWSGTVVGIADGDTLTLLAVRRQRPTRVLLESGCGPRRNRSRRGAIGAKTPHTPPRAER